LGHLNRDSCFGNAEMADALARMKSYDDHRTFTPIRVLGRVLPGA
jgi:hypothetical protein